MPTDFGQRSTHGFHSSHSFYPAARSATIIDRLKCSLVQQPVRLRLYPSRMQRSARSSFGPQNQSPTPFLHTKRISVVPMYVRITRGGRQRDISRLTMTLLGPPRARLQQAGTLPPMYRYIHRRITSAVAGQGMLVYKGGGSRLPSAWASHPPPSHRFDCLDFVFGSRPGVGRHLGLPGVTTAGPHQIPVASVLLLYDVPRRQEPLRLAPIRLTDRVIDPTRGVGWSNLPGAGCRSP